MKLWTSIGKPTINHLTGNLEFHFGQDATQEMNEGMLVGRWWIKAVALDENENGDDMLIVKSVPQRKRD